jgi:hypothetical protein
MSTFPASGTKTTLGPFLLAFKTLTRLDVQIADQLMATFYSHCDSENEEADEF